MASAIAGDYWITDRCSPVLYIEPQIVTTQLPNHYMKCVTCSKESRRQACNRSPSAATLDLKVIMKL